MVLQLATHKIARGLISKGMPKAAKTQIVVPQRQMSGEKLMRREWSWTAPICNDNAPGPAPTSIKALPTMQMIIRRWKSGDKLTPGAWMSYKQRNVPASDLNIGNIKGEWLASNRGGGASSGGKGGASGGGKKGGPSMALIDQPVPINPRHARTLELQRIFLESDGKVPIHLVLPRDVILWRITAALCIGGMAYFLYFLYMMSFDKMKKLK